MSAFAGWTISTRAVKGATELYGPFYFSADILDYSRSTPDLSHPIARGRAGPKLLAHKYHEFAAECYRPGSRS